MVDTGGVSANGCTTKPKGMLVRRRSGELRGTALHTICTYAG